MEQPLDVHCWTEELHRLQGTWCRPAREGGDRECRGTGTTCGSHTSRANFARIFLSSQFAVLELKAILSVLVDTFQFDLRDPDFKVERRSVIVTRPLVIGEETDGNKLPLRVSLAPVDE